MIESIVSDNNISQVIKSKDITQKYCLNLGTYLGRNTGTLFYGINNNEDIEKVINHRGNIVIFLDVTCIINKNLKNIINRLKNLQTSTKLIGIFCDNKETENFLIDNNIKVQNIEVDTIIEETTITNNVIEESINESSMSTIIEADMDSFEKELNEKKKTSKIAQKFEMYVNEISNDELPKNELFKQFMTSYESYAKNNKFDEDKYFDFISTQESSNIESINESIDDESVGENVSLNSDDDINTNYDTQEETLTKNISTLKL